MIKKVFLSIITFIIIVIGTALTGCISEEEQDIEDVAIQTIGFLSTGKFNQAYKLFNETVTDQMPVQQLEEIWSALLTQYGEFEKIVSTRVDEELGFDVVYVTCNFSMLGLLDIKMVFDEEKKIAGFQFVPTEIEYEPPEYVDLEVFDEVNVMVGTGEWELPGTLTIPKGGRPFPVVVLVHGSGPNDRDETIGPNKPFKDIALGLASQGIAVLRYEKRTKEYPQETAKIENFTIQEEVVDDAIDAVDLLMNTSKIDTDRIYIIGHSLGGMMAPEIANQDKRIAGVILLAAPTRHLEDLILDQYNYLFGLDGEINENEAEQIDALEEQIEKIKTLNISEGELILNAPLAYWGYLADYDPVSTAENLTIPMYILQGERDYQVTMEGDFVKWENTFYNSENVTLKSYESLNHLFISGSGQPTNTEYNDPGNVDEQVINDIATWIKNL